MSSETQLSSPENIQSEELLLLDIQTQHAEELEALGITEKAKALINPRNLNHLSRASVAMFRVKDETGAMIEKPTIRFATPSINSYGHETSFSYATVAEIGPESMSLMGDFTMADLETTQKMIAGLKDAQELGVLPHLLPDVASIFDPSTAIILKAPTPAQST